MTDRTKLFYWNNTRSLLSETQGTGSQAERIEAVRKNQSLQERTRELGITLYIRSLNSTVATVHKNTPKCIITNRSPPLIAVLRFLTKSSHPFGCGIVNSSYYYQLELSFQLPVSFVCSYLYVIGRENKTAFLCAFTRLSPRGSTATLTML